MLYTIYIKDCKKITKFRQNNLQIFKGTSINSPFK